MSKDKKGSPEIPIADYKMSIQYGICKGPLDSINQIYIKELPVWCGQMKKPGTLYVNSPEMFGGDNSEGGPDGVIECFFGTEDQLMPNTVAARMKRTTATMPGYRGIANLFFRGYDPAEADLRPEPPESKKTVVGLLGMVYDVFAESDLFGGLFSGSNAGEVKASGGFKWTSNNPYLPGVWVNATRVPKSLSEDFAFIYSEPPDLLEQSRAAGVTLNAYTFVSIASLGWTNADVDAGLIVGSMDLKININGVGLGAGTAVSGSVSVEYECYADNGSGAPGALILDSRVYSGGIYSATANVKVSRVLPSGTRHIRFRPVAIRTYPVFSAIEVVHADYFASKMVYGPSYCTIDNHLKVLPDANPAHMIYEALTDTDTGMGAPRSSVDIPSFMAAAEVFYNEKFGLSMLWSEQEEVEKYISEILDHVQAALFLDPQTGLWTLTPFRADYVVGDLATLSPSNCKASNRQRKSLGETVNEVVVTWTNPNNEKEETITFQDLGNIGAQGGVVSTTRNYYGVRNAKLANRIGRRDIRASSYPLFSAEITADRSMSTLRPGSVVRFSWPEDGIEGLVMRVAKVDYGKPGAGAIKLSVTEDIFGLQHTDYTSIQETLWEDPDVAPSPMDFNEFFTAPLPLLLRSGADLASLSDADYPSVAVAVLTKRQSGGVEHVKLSGPVVKSNGETVIKVIGKVKPTNSNLSNFRMVDEKKTTLTKKQVLRFCGNVTPDTGDFFHIEGLDGDRSSEIVMLDSRADGIWTLARGMFDTVIRDWPSGTRIWYLGPKVTTFDPNLRSDGVEVTYALRPKSGGGVLSYADAPKLKFTPSDRPYAPFRPSNVTLTPVGGTVSSPYPQSPTNMDAESGMSGWIHANMLSAASVPYDPVLLPKEGAKLFTCVNGASTAFMQQQLSFPLTSWERVDAGNMEMSMRWWQAGFDSVTDPVRVEVDFYDAADVLISTFVGPEHFGGAQTWVLQRELFTAPALARSYMFRMKFTRTDGSNLNCHIDSLSINLSAGEFPSFGFTGLEVPSYITVGWSNRNRLDEDTVVKRWGAATVTPEVGQTTTIRVVDSVLGTVEDEITGLTGTSYNLALGSLVNYRFYRIEVSAVRDGYESIQAASRNIQVVQNGYGSNYGFDYGENDGG